LSNEVCPQRVSFHVSHHRQQVAILLNWKRLEPALPDATAGSVPEVVPKGVGRQKPLHPTADVTSPLLCYDYVEVIRHEAGGEQSQVHSSLRLVDESQEVFVFAR
jgi:hypothetical protein